MTDEFDAELIDYLRALPEDTVIAWHSDHLSADHPWSSGWVDVLAPSIQEHVPCGWVWTISSPYDTDRAESLWDFVWPFDLVVYRAWDPDWSWRKGDPDYRWDGPERAAVAHKVDEPFTQELAETLNAGLEGASPEAGVWGAGGWSADEISVALWAWTVLHVGREDLRFQWNPDGGPSEMLNAAITARDRVRSGDEELVTIQDGGEEGITILATEQVARMLGGG